MAKQGAAVFLVHAGCAQPGPKSVSQIMDANVAEACCASSALPTVVVHGLDAFASIRKYPLRVLASLRLDDRPRGVVQDHDLGPPRFELFRRNHEDRPIELRNRDLPEPLQPTEVRIA